MVIPFILLILNFLLIVPIIDHSFRYFGLIVSKDGEIDEEVEHMIKAGWLK